MHGMREKRGDGAKIVTDKKFMNKKPEVGMIVSDTSRGNQEVGCNDSE